MADDSHLPNIGFGDSISSSYREPFYLNITPRCKRIYTDLHSFVEGFPTGLFGTKGQTLSWVKGTMGQAQNLAKGRGGPGQPIKI